MIDPRIEELLEEAYLCQVEQAVIPSDAAADVVKAAEDMGYFSRTDTPGVAGPLTPLGLEMARQVVRRHRLAECLLHDVLAVREETIDQDACQFEHIIRSDVEEKICSLLGHPRLCPHGKAIPPAPCCEHARADQIQDVSPLCDGKAGGEGSVAYLSTRDTREVQKLMAIGVLPGMHIRLLRKFPSFVFEVGYSQFTVDRELAGKIVVHWKHIT